MIVAEIRANVVVQVSDINRPIYDFPGVLLVEAPESVKIGFLYNGTAFTPPIGYAERKAAEANAAATEIILAQMSAADLKIIRALAEGDSARIAAHITSQAILRGRINANEREL